MSTNELTLVILGILLIPQLSPYPDLVRERAA